jgi:UDP-N-acetylglucosamine:LPS N-acetylglucosamine transferase
MRMKKRKQQAPHQEVNVHTIVKDGVAIIVSGHDIMPPLLITKIVDFFQKGSGKGEANA